MSRRRITKKKAAWEFGLASVVSIVCMFVVYTNNESKASTPHTWVSGTVEEWEILNGRSPALRLRLKEQPMEFRVGIDMFREGMDRTVPPGLVQGARISVLVQRAQYAHPVTLQFDRSTQIAWVNGLRVNHKEIFGLATALAWEERNRSWGYALLLASIGAVLYTGIRWRRARAS